MNRNPIKQNLLSKLTPQICELCGLPINVEEGHNYFHNKKSVHRDCWINEVGNEMEQHPIGYVPPRFLN